jgi:hypothetical protein
MPRSVAGPRLLHRGRYAWATVLIKEIAPRAAPTLVIFVPHDDIRFLRKNVKIERSATGVRPPDSPFPRIGRRHFGHASRGLPRNFAYSMHILRSDVAKLVVRVNPPAKEQPW